MRLAHFTTWLLALSGCSLLLAPDESKIRRPDASADAGPDAGPPDGGRDGGPDACVTREAPHELTCAGGMDEDCDGYVDCADYSCASSPECCGGLTTPIFEERWANPIDEWLELGASVTRAAGEIVDFRTASAPNALVYQDCLPLDVGVRLVVAFHLPTQCMAPSICEDDYAALVLTPLPELPAGRGLVADVAVRVSAAGEVSLWRGGEPLHAWAERVVPGATSATVTLELTPGLAAGNVPSLFAQVSIEQPGTGVSFTPLERLPVVLLEDLANARAACAATGNPRGDGLFAAIEGAGDAVRVGTLDADARSCANPALFRPSAALRADGYALGAWAAGGAGAPSLARYVYGGDTRWELWVDASSTPRERDHIDFVWLALGAQIGSNDGASWTARGTEGLVLGTSPTSSPSRREPGFYAHVDRNFRLVGSELKLVFARELPRPTADGGVGGMDGGLVDVTPAYAIFAAQNVPPAATDTVVERLQPLLQPPNTSGCRSLRDPLLLPVGPDLSDGLWLVFTCERAGGQPSSLHIAHVSQDLTSVDMPPQPLLALSESFAARGIYGADGVADFDAGGERVTYRLWLLGRDAGGVSRLAYAEAYDQAVGAVPELVPYPANPILEPDDSLLGSCDGGCTLTGVTVTRISDLDLQLVVSRSVAATSGGVRHELVPLMQVRQR